MDTKLHYKNHLSKIYSWMFGDFFEMVQKQKDFFIRNNILPKANKVAIDLGSGSGFQSLALADLGFKVTAVDFSKELLQELNSKNTTIQTIEGDIRDLTFAKSMKPELVVCMGDTITHLESKTEVFKLIEDISKILQKDGGLIFTFRDLSQPKTDLDRFIPVRSEKSRILTCFLEDDGAQVKVSDLIWDYDGSNWSFSKSSYKKIKISSSAIEAKMLSCSFSVIKDELPSGLQVIIGTKL